MFENQIIYPRGFEIPGWRPAGDSYVSWGEWSSLALVGNHSRDGASIKTPVAVSITALGGRNIPAGLVPPDRLLGVF